MTRATKGQMKPTSWQGEFNGAPVKRDNLALLALLALHVRATDVVANQLANQVTEKVLGMSYD